MASVSKWKGSIKKFASDLNPVLIQQNALVTTFWAALEWEPGAKTKLNEMMRNEVFINIDCIAVRCSEFSSPAHGVIYIHLAKCLAYPEAWKICRYCTSTPIASQKVVIFLLRHRFFFFRLRKHKYTAFLSRWLKVLPGRNHLIIMYISHKSNHLMMVQQMAYVRPQRSSEWTNKERKAAKQSSIIIMLCFLSASFMN